MEIVKEPNGNGAQAQPQTFEAVVVASLQAHGSSSICRECGRAEGWKDWEISPGPVAVPLVPPATGAYVSALLLCRKCGHMRFYSLAYLGIRAEPRRIITPN